MVLTVNIVARELGDRYNMPEVKRMVAEDPSMLEGFSPEEEREMLAELLTKRKRKSCGARATNRAANRAGMIGFAMFSQGHVHDTTVPVTIQSWGALEFFREVLKKDPADVSKLFELWALNREQALTKGDTLLAMQKECTEMIKSGLRQIAKMTKIAMNYENYISAIVEGKGFGLLGWPEEVAFKRMSKQSAIGPLRTLRDALKCGTCRWKVLSTGEK
ncbi:hypothetical protein FB451DRAFT_1035667, partial [Mycena latifolia]